MFWDKLFHRRNTEAFEAIQADNKNALVQLLQAGVSPNARRHATHNGKSVGGKEHGDEFLLTYSLRYEHYALAVELLERGANPYARDWVTGPITEYLYEKVDDLNLLKADASIDYQSHPLLHCLVEVEWQRGRQEPLRGLTNFLPYREADDVDVQKIDAWLEGALELREARHLGEMIKHELTFTTATGSPRQRKM